MFQVSVGYGNLISFPFYFFLYHLSIGTYVVSGFQLVIISQMEG